MSATQFNFGKNWLDYSQTDVTHEKIERARADFDALLGSHFAPGVKFVDLGFGQGLACYLAAERGALVVGVDISPEALRAATELAHFFPQGARPEFRQGSILDAHVLRELAAQGPFDIVHSWGVLHHTGDLWRATQHAAELLRPGGVLVLAIYNHHWSSPLWWFVKWLYNYLPSLQPLMRALFYPPLFLATLLTYGSPRTLPRGMDFYRDLVDWLGGYPYEYATKDEILKKLGQDFTLLSYLAPRVPTGNHQFVLRKVSRFRTGDVSKEGAAMGSDGAG